MPVPKDETAYLCTLLRAIVSTAETARGVTLELVRDRVLPAGMVDLVSIIDDARNNLTRLERV